MANASLAWRTQHAGVKLSDIKTLSKQMTTIARKVKDANGDGEAQASELKKAAAPAGKEIAALMEKIRYGSGFYARDAIAGGNPVFAYNEFVDNYKDLPEQFGWLDGDKNGVLDVKELRGVNSKMRQSDSTASTLGVAPGSPTSARTSR